MVVCYVPFIISTIIRTVEGWRGVSAEMFGRVPNRFFGIWDLAFFKVGIRDFNGKERRYSGLELGTGSGI